MLEQLYLVLAVGKASIYVVLLNQNFYLIINFFITGKR